MITELLIPKQYMNHPIFNIIVLQVYVGMILGGLYLARELVLKLLYQLVDVVSNLLIETYTETLYVAIKITMMPVHFFNQIVLNHFPSSKTRIKMLERVAYETGDRHLYTLILSGLEQDQSLVNIKKIEKSVIQFCKNRDFITEHDGKDGKLGAEVIEAKKAKELPYVHV